VSVRTKPLKPSLCITLVLAKCTASQKLLQQKIAVSNDMHTSYRAHITFITRLFLKILRNNTADRKETDEYYWHSILYSGIQILSPYLILACFHSRSSDLSAKHKLDY
jgi:hypothetical protein